MRLALGCCCRGFHHWASVSIIQFTMHTYTWVIIWGSAETHTVSEPSPSHLPSATREAGAVAALAERSKQDKYAALNQCHNFTLVAIERAGPFEPETFLFFWVAILSGSPGKPGCSTCGNAGCRSATRNAIAVMGTMGVPPPFLISYPVCFSFFGWGTECLPFNWLPVFTVYIITHRLKLHLKSHTVISMLGRS